MSNPQELHQVANDLDKDELVCLLVEAQMKNEQLTTLEKINEGQMKMVKMLKEKWNEEQEKNKKLKEEKDEELKLRLDLEEDLVKLKEELDQSEKQRYEDNEKARGVITEVCNENATLKEDITTHPDFAAIATDWYERHNWLVDVDEYNELKEQNETLQHQYDMAIQIDNNKISHLEVEIKDLEEENKDLKEENKLIRSED